jgi:hypothetical protein
MYSSDLRSTIKCMSICFIKCIHINIKVMKDNIRKYHIVNSVKNEKTIFRIFI